MDFDVSPRSKNRNRVNFKFNLKFDLNLENIIQSKLIFSQNNG